MTTKIKIRRDQADAAKKVLDDLRAAEHAVHEAQIKADYLLAGILAGRAKGRVLGVDVVSCRLEVEEADATAA